MFVAFVISALAASDEHLAPQQSLAKIQLPPGLVAELVACEPNVESPVAISFDEFGRMFVAEYRDYPQGPPKGEPPLSRIRLLEDKDGDGFFETAKVFADKLNFAQGVLCLQGGVIVTAAPDILFLKDTNGDGVADEKKVLFTGFKEGNPQLRVSHPKLGIDNLVYVSNGLSGGEIRHVAAKRPVVPLARDDFRFDPKTMIGEATTGFGQFGNTFDDWGRRFTCSNRNPIMHSILPKRVLNRNDQIPIPVGYYDVAPFGADSKIYPIARTATTAESHAGTNTAACGLHIYRGDQMPELRGDAFACEPTGFLVTRYKLHPLGAGFRAERIPASDGEFLASTDTWFRPVSLADGPDGALYVVDMHREVIEHPEYLPKGLEKDLRFRAGAEKGRILRIKQVAGIGRKLPEQRSFKPARTNADCLALLTEQNGWRRDLGQRLLVEREARDAATGLRRLRRQRHLFTSTHVVWTLRGLESLTVEDVLEAANTDNGYLAEAELLASAPLIEASPRLRDAIVETADKRRGARETMNAAILLGDVQHRGKIRALGRAAASSWNFRFDPWVARAVLTACAGREGELFEAFVESSSVRTMAPTSFEIVSLLCAAAVNRDEDQLRIVLRTTATRAPGIWRNPALKGLVEGFRKPNPWKSKSLEEFLQSPPKSLEKEVRSIIPLVNAAETMAFDKSPLTSLEGRATAIELAAQRTSSRRKLLDLVCHEEPADVQVAVLKAFQNHNPKPVVEKLVSVWLTLPPAVQQAAVDFAFRRRDSQLQFLKAIEAGKVPGSAVGAERREMMLVFSGDKEIKPLAQKLFGVASSNRAKLIEEYLPTVRQGGDYARGKEVFQRVCATCHKLKGVGVAVGPELADVRQKSKETLLTEILDPNRTVEPRWVSYIAALNDGRTVVGLLSSDNGSAVGLKLPNGVEQMIPRGEIERMQSSGRSLMPEGVEKDVTPKQMADLIEFLTTAK